MEEYQRNNERHRFETINLMDAYKIKYWCQRLAVSESILRRAIEQVGDKVAEVGKFLKEQGK